MKLNRDKFPLMIELKPVFSKKNLILLIKKVKNYKNFNLTSFHDQNLINLYRLKKSLTLGIIFSPSAKIKQFKNKSKKKYIKLLVAEKKFLKYPELDNLKVPVYYYTAKRKNIFQKYKYSKNLIFENL